MIKKYFKEDVDSSLRFFVKVDHRNILTRDQNANEHLFESMMKQLEEKMKTDKTMTRNNMAVEMIDSVMMSLFEGKQEPKCTVLICSTKFPSDRC